MTDWRSLSIVWEGATVVPRGRNTMPRLPDDLATALNRALESAEELSPVDAAIKRADLLIELERQVRRRVEPAIDEKDKVYESTSIAMVGTAAQYHQQRVQRVKDGIVTSMEPSQYSNERGMFKSSDEVDEAYVRGAASA